MKKEVFGFDVKGSRGINDPNDFSIGLDDHCNVAINLDGAIITREKFIPNIKKLKRFLYEISFNRLNYEDGYNYFAKRFHRSNGFGCSAIRKDNFFGRNFDWTYSYTATFIVRTDANQGRNATIGVAADIPELTDKFVNSGKYSDKYAVIPFLTLDGINDKGLVAELNIVPVDKGLTTGTNPGKREICGLMVVRYLLDYADSVDDALEKIQELNIYANNNPDKPEEYHMMIADPTKSAIIEIVENNVHIMTDDTTDEYDNIPGNKPIMTNFYLSGWNGDPVSVALGNTVEEVKASGLSDHSEGIERYIKLANAYDSIESIDDMVDTMKSIYYTKAYSETENPLWYSELNGDYGALGELTIYNQASSFDMPFDVMRERFEHRNREDGQTWQTIHSSVYDIDKKMFKINVQEESDEFEFYLNDENKKEIKIGNTVLTEEQLIKLIELLG